MKHKSANKWTVQSSVKRTELC